MGVDDQIAVRVSRDLAGAELFELRLHLRLGTLRGVQQHNLIVLDDMARQEGGVVGDELPIWYFTKSFRLPTAAMLERLSIACSTSGGTDTFSTMKLVSSMPYFA